VHSDEMPEVRSDDDAGLSREMRKRETGLRADAVTVGQRGRRKEIVPCHEETEQGHGGWDG